MDKLIEQLNFLNIQYQILDHEVITTMEQGMEIMKKLQGVVPVNIFLKDKKDNYYLMIKNMNNKMKINEIGKKLNIKDLQSVKSDMMQEVLQVPSGCVTVFALVNAKFTILIDEMIPKDGLINFHPLVNNKTMTISYDDMIKFIKYYECNFIYFM